MIDIYRFDSELFHSIRYCDRLRQPYSAHMTPHLKQNIRNWFVFYFNQFEPDSCQILIKLINRSIVDCVEFKINVKWRT